MQQAVLRNGLLQTDSCKDIRRYQMDYGKGYVFELMEKGGPTDVREPYFKEAVEEMMRARTLCAKAAAVL